jgi:DNA-binding response OmpR family regulator
LPAAPLEELEDTARHDDSIGSELGDSDASILLVAADDHATYIVKGILMAAGYQVMLADDPAGALRLARTKRPQLAVIDVAKGDRDGLALVEIFSHDPDTRKTSVLVIGAAEERATALRAGADELVTRPIEPASFRKTCSRLIAEAGRALAPRILVVDDEPTIRTICADVLTNAGYTVHTVADGSAALSEAERFRPDLMLIDVMMPGLDGFATAERFRAESATSMTPIIFVSARSETADKVRAFRIGAEDYVVKPFDAAELVARVGKALDRHSRELAASPTTQLPGSDVIENEIEFRLANATATDAFCYLDLDNLKAFNDYYGYAKADGVIRQTGDLIRQVIARDGSAADFIGHIAGDDFVFVTSADNVDQVCTSICRSFDRLIPLYYNRSDREHGFIETEDRYGTLRRFPIMGVSIAAVTRAEQPMTTFSELAAAAAAGKTLAKSVSGSAYVRDGKIVIGDLDHAPD